VFLAAAGLVLPRGSLAQERPRLPAALPEGTRAEAVFASLPGKQPLIKLAYRAPNYETPIHYFNTLLTPNDAFFVRYHLADIPEVDEHGWRLRVDGDAAGSPLELTMDDLRRLDSVEVTAVCQCSGNRRGLFQPHVPGVQWSNGAMGNARWRGVRLKEVLDKAGMRQNAVEVAFDGADGPVIDKTPDFQKSLPIWKALDENTLIAIEMNGAPLPHWNGFPARLVVPGWTATYWMKHLTSISVLAKPFDGFWMKSAYRVPTRTFPIIEHFLTQATEANEPITEILVNSLITNIADGQRVGVGRPVELRGIAWDGGYGIRAVEISSDDGKTWRNAALGQDAGRFSFRSWGYRWTPQKAGRQTILARASNHLGQTQSTRLIPNPAGYYHNLPARVTLTAV
jgi:DMSO/TMAO reductase YedYZ molybdopterin-dependent catalytic subunit